MSVLQSQMATADSATNATITLSNPTAGSTGLLIFSVGCATSINPSIGSITLGGSAGNWTSQFSAGGGANHSFVNCWSDLNCAAGQTSIVVTPTGGSGSGSMLYWVFECDDLPLSGTLIDQSATFDSAGFVSTWTIGPTSATTHSSERIFAVGGGNGTGSNTVTTFTGPGAPWTNFQQGRWSGSTHTPSGICGYQDVSSTGTQSYSVSASSQTTTIDGLIITIPLVSVQPPAQISTPPSLVPIYGVQNNTRFIKQRSLSSTPSVIVQGITATDKVTANIGLLTVNEIQKSSSNTLFNQAAPGATSTGTTPGTFATMFNLSQSAALTGIWHYSGAGESALPSACGIYDNATGTIVSGTLNNAPSWSGALGSGWVKCSYDGSVTLDNRAGGYSVACLFPGNHTYSNSGSAAFPVTSGILTAPATGTINGSTFHNGPFDTATGSLTVPNGSDTTSDFNWLVDVEVSLSDQVNVAANFGRIVITNPATAQPANPDRVFGSVYRRAVRQQGSAVIPFHPNSPTNITGLVSSVSVAANYGAVKLFKTLTPAAVSESAVLGTLKNTYTGTASHVSISAQPGTVKVLVNVVSSVTARANYGSLKNAASGITSKVNPAAIYGHVQVPNTDVTMPVVSVTAQSQVGSVYVTKAPSVILWKTRLVKGSKAKMIAGRV